MLFSFKRPGPSQSLSGYLTVHKFTTGSRVDVMNIVGHQYRYHVVMNHRREKSRCRGHARAIKAESKQAVTRQSTDRLHGVVLSYGVQLHALINGTLWRYSMKRDFNVAIDNGAVTQLLLLLLPLWDAGTDLTSFTALHFVDEHRNVSHSQY